MNLRCAMIGLVLLTTPAFAEDISPWFGSEATQAEQISLISQSESSLAESSLAPIEEASLSISEQCANEGCPATTNLAK
jgi:hypothetical protein